MEILIHEVGGIASKGLIKEFNALEPEWPELQERHFTHGFWWIAFLEEEPVAFAGLVPFLPKIGYLKRCFVKRRGYGLQYRLMAAREIKAKQLGWTHLVSDCRKTNEHSANNFRKAGYDEFIPEQPWEVDSIYWIKSL